MARTPGGGRWAPDLCGRCRVPAIQRANACTNLVLQARVRQGSCGLGRGIDISATCARSSGPVATPEVGLWPVPHPAADRAREPTMIEALLLDLDGTLLDNDIQPFLQVYLEASAGPWRPGWRRIPGAAAPSLDQRDAGESGPDAHAARRPSPATSTRRSGTTEGALLARFEDFYRDEFPKLQAQTTQRPAAARLVQAALDSDLRLAVATNPLFPRIAIDHRLSWAGVPSDRFALRPRHQLRDLPLRQAAAGVLRRDPRPSRRTSAAGRHGRRQPASTTCRRPGRSAWQSFHVVPPSQI